MTASTSNHTRSHGEAGVSMKGFLVALMIAVASPAAAQVIEYPPRQMDGYGRGIGTCFDAAGLVDER